MNDPAETVGETVAAEVTAAIETATENADQVKAVAESILEGALATEQARIVRDLEKDVDECLSNQAALSEAVTGMALQMETMSGALSTLQALLPSMVSPPTISPSAEADGQPENPEAAVTTVVAETAEIVQAPPETVTESAPARRKRNWI
jgi:hypothetical protein